MREYKIISLRGTIDRDTPKKSTGVHTFNTMTLRVVQMEVLTKKSNNISRSVNIVLQLTIFS